MSELDRATYIDMDKSQKSYIGQKRYIKTFREWVIQQIVFSKIHHTFISGPHMLSRTLTFPNKSCKERARF